MMRLCDFILQRDPRIRPTLSELHDSVDRLIASNLEKTRFVKEPIIPQTLLLQNGEEIDDFCFNDDYAHAIHSNESEVSDVMAITQHWDIRLPRKNNGLSCKNWHDQVSRDMLLLEGLYRHVIFVTWVASRKDPGSEGLSKVYSNRDYSVWKLECNWRDFTSERMESDYLFQFARSQISSDFFIFLSSIAQCRVLYTMYAYDDRFVEMRQREDFLSMLMRTLLFTYRCCSQRECSVISAISHWSRMNTASRLSILLPPVPILKELRAYKTK